MLNVSVSAGERIPGLSVSFEAAVAQPPIEQLSRQIQVRVYRSAAAEVDAGMGSAASGVQIQSPSSSSFKGAEAPLLVRLLESAVPPVPGSRYSTHDIELGCLETAGRFTVGFNFSAQRVMTSRTVDLATPAVEHLPLSFVVNPTTAIASQSKVWLFDPRTAPELRSSLSTWDKVAFWNKEVSMRSRCECAAVEAAKLSSSAALASAAPKRDGPLVVQAGEPVLVRVLTRDKYLNPSSCDANKLVAAGLRLVAPTNGSSKQRLPQSKASQASSAAGDVWLPTEYAPGIYQGGGVHEVQFIRELAGCYEASATLRDELIGSKSTQHELALEVVHGPVHPPSCRLRELPQNVVDQRALTAALERERVRAHKEHVRAGNGEGFTAMNVGVKGWHYEPPACMPERVVGTMELTAFDKFGNQCASGNFTWRVAMVAQETWKPEVNEDEQLPAALIPEPVTPASVGETWVQEMGDAVYQVHWRGSAGRYLINITDAGGVHCAGSPVAVLIVPPAGGPESARPHGTGARSAVADEWAHFLLRPSEFVGCEPGPCEQSQKLFDRLRVQIVPRDAARVSGSAQSPVRTRQAKPPAISEGDPISVTLSPTRSKASGVRDAHPEPDAIFIEKHFGDGVRPRGWGPRRNRTQFRSNPPPILPPPEVEPGAHMVRFRVKVAGDYKLHIHYGRNELLGSPYDLHVFPSLLCVDRCRVVGLCETTGEVLAGHEVSGSILLADKCGNPVVPGPHVLGIPVRLTVEAIGPALDPCGVVEQGVPKCLELEAEASELYPTVGANARAANAAAVGARFSFSLRVAGWYRVTAWVANTRLPLPSGCYPLLVHPLDPDPGMCRVEDPPDLTAPLPAGERFGVLAVLRDTFGNVCSSGGFELRATIRAPDEPVQAAHAVPFACGFLPARGMVMWDRRDGTYEAVFTPRALGRHTLTLAMAHGTHAAIIGRPMEYEIIPGLPSPEHCVVKGDGTRWARAEVPAQFVVEARDKAGNLVAEHGLVLRVVLTPGSQLQQLQVQACGDGRYIVRYQVPHSGLYRLSVLVGTDGSVRPKDRRHVRGSPFQVPVHSGDKGTSVEETRRQTPPSSPRYMRARSLSPASPRGSSRGGMPSSPRGGSAGGPRGEASSTTVGVDGNLRFGSPRGRSPGAPQRRSGLTFDEMLPDAALFPRSRSASPSPVLLEA